MVDFWECGLIFQRLKSESVSVNVFHLLFADEKERGRERGRRWMKMEMVVKVGEDG